MSLENPVVSEFTRYYEDHKNLIFNYLLYRVGFNRGLAEDLTSEVFLKAWKAFASYDRSRSFKTWIFTVAHNHLVNFYVSRKKDTLSLDDAIQVVKEDGSNAEDLSKKLEVKNVLEIVDELPEGQREVVVMKYVNDLRNEEIAQALGKEEGAVRTALSRAIATIRDKYLIKLRNQPNGEI